MPFDSLPLRVKYDRVGNVLIEVRDLIANDGWCKGTSRDRYQRHCILGAIQEIAGINYRLRTQLAERIVSVLPRVKTQSEWPLRAIIMRWNDRRSRRIGQVLAKLDQAIVKSRVRDYP